MKNVKLPIGFAKEITSRLAKKGFDCSIWSVYRVAKEKVENPIIELELLLYKIELKKVEDEIKVFQNAISMAKTSK